MLAANQAVAGRMPPRDSRWVGYGKKPTDLKAAKLLIYDRVMSQKNYNCNDNASFVLLAAMLCLVIGGCGKAAQGRPLSAVKTMHAASREQAAMTLPKLKTPPGFSRAQQCPEVGTYTVCFNAAPSIALDKAAMRLVVASLNAHMAEEEGYAAATGCEPAIRKTAPRQVVVCRTHAMFGQNLLQVVVTSIFASTPITPRGVSHTCEIGSSVSRKNTMRHVEGELCYGTEISVSDVGYY